MLLSDHLLVISWLLSSNNCAWLWPYLVLMSLAFIQLWCLLVRSAGFTTCSDATSTLLRSLYYLITMCRSIQHTSKHVVLCPAATVSEIFLPQLFRRRLLASGQDRQQTLHTCYFWQAASAGVQSTAPAHSVCLRSVEIFDWKDWQNKKSAARAAGHDHVAGDIPWAERYRFRRVVGNRC